MPKKKRKYLEFKAHVPRAALLQQRVKDGVATPAETEEYHHMLKLLRQRYRAGNLSPGSARHFGIE